MWCEAGFSPDTFLKQTAATFAASLRGKAKQIQRETDQDLWHAWQVGAFAGAAFNGKLKSFAEYRRERKNGYQTPQEMLGTLRLLKDMGAPMTIRQVN